MKGGQKDAFLCFPTDCRNKKRRGKKKRLGWLREPGAKRLLTRTKLAELAGSSVLVYVHV